MFFVGQMYMNSSKYKAYMCVAVDYPLTNPESIKRQNSVRAKQIKKGLANGQQRVCPGNWRKFTYCSYICTGGGSVNSWWWSLNILLQSFATKFCYKTHQLFHARMNWNAWSPWKIWLFKRIHNVACGVVYILLIGGCSTNRYICIFRWYIWLRFSKLLLLLNDFYY